MATHSYHPALEGYDPGQVFHDGCPECERRGKDLRIALAYMDPERFKMAWHRAYTASGPDRNKGRIGRISHAEAPLLDALHGVQVKFEAHGVTLGVYPPDEMATLRAALSTAGMLLDSGQPARAQALIRAALPVGFGLVE